MNNPSYETFIRICQSGLININGTSIHFSNHSPSSPTPLFFSSFFFCKTLSCPSPSLLPPCASFLLPFPHFLSASSFSCLYHPRTLTISSILTSSADANKEWVMPPLLPPLFSLGPVKHLHPPPTSLSFPSLPPSLSSPLQSLLSPPFFSPRLNVLHLFSLRIFMQITPSALCSLDSSLLKTVWSSSIHLCQTALVP